MRKTNWIPFVLEQSLKQEAVFYTSFCYNYVLWKLRLRRPYDRVDERVVLGALPLRSTWPQLQEQERITHVLSLVEQHEVKSFAVDRSLAETQRLTYLNLPLLDFSGVPSTEQLKEGAKFIESCEAGGSVYVHCKAGRTRSAMMVVAYLLRAGAGRRSLSDVITFLRQRRPCVVFPEAHMTALRAFETQLTPNP